MTNQKSRTKTEYEVSMVEFYMGTNDDIVDIRAGGSPVLSFWVYTSLSEQLIQGVANDRYLQEVIKSHGGNGSFKITKVWAEKFVKTEKRFRDKCLELAKSF